MKLATVMLCGILLVLGQVWLTPVAPAATCARICHMPCCQGGMMSCCAAHPAGAAKPVSSVPLRGSLAMPLLLPLALAAAWKSPAWAARQSVTYRPAPVYARKSPLFARDCSRLI